MSELVRRTSTNNPAVLTPLGDASKRTVGGPDRSGSSALADEVAVLRRRVAAFEEKMSKAVVDERRMADFERRMAKAEAVEKDQAPAPTKKAHGIHMALFLAANAEGTSRKKRWALMLVSIFIILGQCTVLDVIVQESSHPRCMQHLQRVGLH